MGQLSKEHWSFQGEQSYLDLRGETDGFFRSVGELVDRKIEAERVLGARNVEQRDRTLNTLDGYWFDLYLRQGYSRRESRILAQQICGSYTGPDSYSFRDENGLQSFMLDAVRGILAAPSKTDA